jgi:predicted lipoprotein with Yx(FWY)xxD motif
MNRLGDATMLVPMPRLLAIAVLCASLALAACGDDSDDASPDAAPAAETTTEDETQAEAAEKDAGGDEPEAKPGTEIKIADSQFGSILFDADDQVIYLFDKENSDESECYDDCAAEWPPVLTKGEPVAGNGADAKLLGTTERDDDSTQVTYKGHPLYYYAHEGPGEVLCHNVTGFGGLWLVVQPNGDAVS